MATFDSKRFAGRSSLTSLIANLRFFVTLAFFRVSLAFCSLRPIVWNNFTSSSYFAGILFGKYNCHTTEETTCTHRTHQSTIWRIRNQRVITTTLSAEKSLSGQISRMCRANTVISQSRAYFIAIKDVIKRRKGMEKN